MRSSQQFSVMSGRFPGQAIKFLAPVRLKPAIPRFEVEHSSTKPLCSSRVFICIRVHNQILVLKCIG